MEYFKTVKEMLKSKLFNGLKLYKSDLKQLDILIKNFNKKIIRDNSPTIKNFILYNVPGDWSVRLEKIKTEFYRDSSSLNSYKIRFGDEIGLKKFNDKLKSTTVTKQYCINKYGIEKGLEYYSNLNKSKRSVGKNIMIDKYGKKEGEQKWNNYLVRWKSGIEKRKKNGNWKNGLTLEEMILKHGNEKGFDLWKKRCEKSSYIGSLKYYIDVFGDVDGLKKWEEYCKKHDYTSSKYYIRQYGEKEGKIKYQERCKNISYFGSLEYYIIKYGEVEGRKRKKEAIEKSFLNHKFKLTRYSKISQKLFWEVYNLLSEEQQLKCHFAELNKEYMFYIHSKDIKVFMVDFKLKNKVIEFNGDYWHSLPNNIKTDEIKNKILKDKGYDLLTIKESEYKSNPNKIVKQIIKFINNEKIK